MEYSKRDIERLFERLNDELARRVITGEVYVVGGAVMCLVFDARPSTRDIDAYFRPAMEVRAAARAVAAASGLPGDWLNDAVKGYLSNKEDFHPYLDLSNLRVLTASPEYLLAMKCLAMRLGAGFHDEDDVLFSPALPQPHRPSQGARGRHSLLPAGTTPAEDAVCIGGNA